MVKIYISIIIVSIIIPFVFQANLAKNKKCKDFKTSSATRTNQNGPETKYFTTRKANYQKKNAKTQFLQHRYYRDRFRGIAYDPRLNTFKLEWFEGKDVLDIGTHEGNITRAVARDFKPKRVLGIDTDRDLVETALKKLRLPKMQASKGEEANSVLYPFNIDFRQENYVLENDRLLQDVKPEYDVIMALSMSGMVHLTSGDDGLKRLFRRTFLNLHPGGLFIFEPHNFNLYKLFVKSLDSSPEVQNKYRNIRLFPKDFEKYLVDEVGYKLLDVQTPQHPKKTFSRKIFVLLKP